LAIIFGKNSRIASTSVLVRSRKVKCICSGGGQVMQDVPWPLSALSAEFIAWRYYLVACTVSNRNGHRMSL